MKEKISSAIKLIFSLSLGAFLIFYFYNSISKPKAYSAPEAWVKGNYKVVKVSAPGTYIERGSPILYGVEGLDTIPLNAEIEAAYSLNIQPGEVLTSERNKSIGTYSIDVMRIIREVFAEASWLWLFLSLIAAILSHIFRSLRWRMMLQAMQYNPSFQNTFFAVMIMYLANLAFPRLGEVMRCGVLNRYEKIPLEKSVGTMVTERFIDVLSLGLVGLLMLILQYNVLASYIQKEYMPGIQTWLAAGSWWKMLAFAALGIGAFILILRFLKNSNNKIAVKFRSIMLGLLEGIKSVKDVSNKGLLILYSAGIWIGYIGTIYCCIKAVPDTSVLGIPESITVLFFGSFAILAVQGGLGAYPLLVGKVMLLYQIPESVGYAYGWLSWVAQTSMVLLLGFLSMILISVLNESQKK